MRTRLAAAVAGVCLASLAVGTAWAGRHVVAGPGEEVADGLIVRMRAGARFTGSKVPQRFMSSSRWRALDVPNFHRVQVDPADQLAVGAALAADPGVDLVEPDRIRHIDISAPNDPRYAEQWSLTAIPAQQAWQWFPGRYVDSTLNPDRVRVAVLDTGVDCTHPDFANSGNSSTNVVNGGQLNWAP